MAASARDLLTLVGAEARRVEGPTVEQAEAAITALGYAARELQRLADRAGNPQRWTAVGQLTGACHTATAAWPARSGRLPDLVGAACDVLAGHDRDLAADERWAVAVAAYAPAALDAAANLSRVLRQERARGPLPISAALATVAAGEDAARRCATFASTSGGMNDGAWRHAPDGWRVAYAALVRFHDGSRRRNAEPSETVRAAFGLQQALRRVGRGVHLDADAATALRAVANHLPLLARELGRAAQTWGRESVLFARARDLLHTDELVPAILHRATVPAGAEHLVPVIAAIRATERLSAALSTELNRTAGQLGHQPQPYLASAHAAQATSRQLRADAAWTTRLAGTVNRVEIRSASRLEV